MKSFQLEKNNDIKQNIKQNMIKVKYVCACQIITHYNRLAMN